MKSPPAQGKRGLVSTTISFTENLTCAFVVAEAFFIVQQPLVDQDLLIIGVSLSHSDTSHSVGLLWTCDQPDAQTSTWQHTTLAGERYLYPPGEIRTRIIPVSEKPKTHALESAATRIGITRIYACSHIPMLTRTQYACSHIHMLTRTHTSYKSRPLADGH